ncbi:ZP domain-containing protein-like [Amia ocellicauda]|uniref:ZP domain-containing protein-like n=1 Tax=Amia ocellicauda TaxID=2972642 RepID=UPI0034642F27
MTQMVIKSDAGLGKQLMWTETHDGLIFRNEIVSVDNTDDVITRKHLTEIPFSCTYSKIGRASSQFKTHQSAYVFTETSFGSFSYVFEFYSNNTFRQMIEPSAYPVQVQLQEMLYISIQAHTSLSNTELFVESCMATPKDDPSESMHYDIIKNGCNKDNTIVVYPSSPSEFRFEMEAFKFIGEFNEVYISCTVILCQAGNPFTRCAQGCSTGITARHHHHRRQVSAETGRHSISQWPLHLARSLGSAVSSVNLNLNIVWSSDLQGKGVEDQI